MTKQKLDPIDPDHQAALCFAALATWLAKAPGRRVVITHASEGFHCVLVERREMHGATLQEAAAQGAQVAMGETELYAEVPR